MGLEDHIQPIRQPLSSLSKEEKSLSAQLMRVNLAGEVAAQALYRGQAMVCKDAEIKNHSRASWRRRNRPFNLV